MPIDITIEVSSRPTSSSSGSNGPAGSTANHDHGVGNPSPNSSGGTNNNGNSASAPQLPSYIDPTWPNDRIQRVKKLVSFMDKIVAKVYPSAGNVDEKTKAEVRQQMNENNAQMECYFNSKLMLQTLTASGNQATNSKIYDQTQLTLEVLADISGQLSTSFLQGAIKYIAELRKNLLSLMHGNQQQQSSAAQALSMEAINTFGGPFLAAKGIKVVSTALNFALFSKKASKALIGETIELYRAVQSKELEQISKTNTFKILPGMIEGKYFATTLEGAQQYAAMAESAFSDPPYSFVKTSIPKSVADKILGPAVDRGIETVFVPSKTLKQLTPEIIEPELIKQRAFR